MVVEPAEISLPHVPHYCVENVPSLGVRQMILRWNDAEGVPMQMLMNEFSAMNLERTLRHWINAE